MYSLKIRMAMKWKFGMSSKVDRQIIQRLPRYPVSTLFDKRYKSFGTGFPVFHMHTCSIAALKINLTIRAFFPIQYLHPLLQHQSCCYAFRMPAWFLLIIAIIIQHIAVVCIKNLTAILLYIISSYGIVL